MTDRKIELLNAVFCALSKAQEGHYVTDILDTVYEYDGTECDGYCLADDIADELDTG